MAIAVLDIGKTNVKLVLFGPGGVVLAERSRPNAPLAGPPYRHADVAGIWAFLLASLTELNRRHPIRVIVPTTHGATAALVSADDPDGLALPVLDYEDAIVGDIEPGYAPLRPAFAETASPPMGVGLNLGRQLAFQRARFPEAWARVRHVLLYPSYWAWRLTGQAAGEVTSLGCHTDLWSPPAGDYSSLVDRLGLRGLLPPLVPPFAAIGTLLPDIAAQTGLAATVPVLAGIHDSNASLLPYLLARTPPFAVVSTGTWVVVMGVGARLDGLDPTADMLANVAADGQPVACAKFMGGREFAALAGPQPAPADIDDLRAVVAAGVLGLPAFALEGGPYAGQTGEISGTLPDRPGARTALAALYCALMTDDLLARLKMGDAPVIVDGGFVKTPLFAQILATLRPTRPVDIAPQSAGSAQGAALLADWPQPPQPIVELVPAADLPGLAAYAVRWRQAVLDRAGASAFYAGQ